MYIQIYVTCILMCKYVSECRFRAYTIHTYLRADGLLHAYRIDAYPHKAHTGICM